MVLETTEKMKFSTEEEAKEAMEVVRQEASKKGYIVKKVGYERKEKKAKGEIIAEAFVVTVVKTWNGLWDDLVEV